MRIPFSSDADIPLQDKSEGLDMQTTTLNGFANFVLAATPLIAVAVAIITKAAGVV